MEIIIRTSVLKNESFGIGLGNFDGLHIGHFSLINTLINESRQENIKSLLYTFNKHPEHILRKKLFNQILTSQNKKIEILKDTGLDFLYFDEFDEAFSRILPKKFVEEILVKRLGIKLAVIGADYKFGFKGQGDVDYLCEMGKKYKFRVVVVPQVTIDNSVVSSTRIRQLVKSGNVDAAFKLLGRHYFLTGKVISGKQIGRTLGFPTANLEVEENILIPHTGTYATKTKVDGIYYVSVTSIGINPTIGFLDKLSVETYILDYNENLYNKLIEVSFISKLRNEKKFKNKKELIEQIKKDVERTKKMFSIE